MVFSVLGSKRKINYPWPGLMTEDPRDARRLKAQGRRTMEPPSGRVAHTLSLHNREGERRQVNALDKPFAGYRALA